MGLEEVGGWQKDDASAKSLGNFENIDNSFDGAEMTVEGEFANEEGAVDVFGAKLM